VKKATHTKLIENTKALQKAKKRKSANRLAKIEKRRDRLRRYTAS
jgi:hypothetical protein